jgi:hypothetical protein
MRCMSQIARTNDSVALAPRRSRQTGSWLETGLGEMGNEIGRAAQKHEIFQLPKNLRVSALATHSF